MTDTTQVRPVSLTIKEASVKETTGGRRYLSVTAEGFSRRLSCWSENESIWPTLRTQTHVRVLIGGTEENPKIVGLDDGKQAPLPAMPETPSAAGLTPKDHHIARQKGLDLAVQLTLARGVDPGDSTAALALRALALADIFARWIDGEKVNVLADPDDDIPF